MELHEAAALLGVDVAVTATEESLKKAYRRAILGAHPDKPGGSTEQFHAVTEAYEVLLEHCVTEAEQVREPVREPRRRPERKPRPRRITVGPDKVHVIPLTLAEVWSGKTFVIKMTRHVRCSTCYSLQIACVACDGTGRNTVNLKLFGMLSMNVTTSVCLLCAGAGSIQSCSDCNGQGLRVTEQLVTAQIPRGVHDRERIVTDGLCSESYDYDVPGRVVLGCHVVSDCVGVNTNRWKRLGNHVDLSVTIRIRPEEAENGWRRILTDHPSGEALPIVVSKADSGCRVFRVEGYGMPHKLPHNSSDNETDTDSNYGDLFVECYIVPDLPEITHEETEETDEITWIEATATTITALPC